MRVVGKRSGREILFQHFFADLVDALRFRVVIIADRDRKQIIEIRPELAVDQWRFVV